RDWSSDVCSSDLFLVTLLTGLITVLNLFDPYNFTALYFYYNSYGMINCGQIVVVYSTSLISVVTLILCTVIMNSLTPNSDPISIICNSLLSTFSILRSWWPTTNRPPDNNILMQ